MAKTKKYYKVKNLNEQEFKRVVGVKKETFNKMVKVVRKHYRDKKVVTNHPLIPKKTL